MLAIAVAMSACNNSNVQETIVEAQERQGWTNFAGVRQMDSGFIGITLPALRGNVESVKIRRTQYGGENDFLLFLFNERGDVAEWGYYSGGYTFDKYVYLYGSNGRLESEYMFGIFDGYNKHIYNNQNQRVQTIAYNMDHSLKHRYNYKYDAAGNMIQDGIATYCYDFNGNKTIKKSGNTISSTWAYDAQGRLIESTEDDGDYHYSKNVYTYDSTGRLNKIDSYYKEDINEVYAYWGATEYVYDNFGNVVEERFSNANGESNGKVSYSYDSHGNVVAKDDITFEITYRK